MRIILISLLFSIFFFFLIINLVRKKYIQEAYALLWIVMGLVFILLSVFPDLVGIISGMVGIYYAPAGILLVLSCVMILIIFQLTIVVSRKATQIKNLTQEFALLKVSTRTTLIKESFEAQNSILIIVPCYNEEGHIANLIKEIATELPESKIIIINDCSTDDSEKVARETGLAEIISLPVNLGIGGAVQVGIKYAARNNFDFVVRLDGDGQHPVKHARDVLKPLIDGIADVAIGSRFVQPDNCCPTVNCQLPFKSTPLRRIGIHFFRGLNKVITGQTITDNTSGFRAYNRKAIEFLSECYPAFDYPEPEEITLLGLNGFRMKEVAVQMEDRKFGISSINSLRSIYYMIKVSFAILMVAIRKKTFF